MSYPSLTLSRSRLSAFLACRRRFQLSVIEPLVWPPPPRSVMLELAQWRGKQFHLLLERHFRGFPPAAAPIADHQVAAWQRRFREQAPPMPAGERLVEYSLTVPLGDFFLTGRFDLLIVDGQQAHIFDWKTENNPRSAAELSADFQTVLYLAMAVEGSHGIHPGGAEIDPDQLHISYWYVNRPDQSVTIGYNAATHQKNWARLTQVAADLAAQIAADEPIWALTENESHCAACLYRIYCGKGLPDRDATAQPTFFPEDEERRLPQLEPLSYF